MGFEPEEWLGNPDYIALTNDDKSFGLFEKRASRLYTGHYAFSVGGREAIDLGKEMLVFMERQYGMEICIGMTPVNLKHALWMNRKLGFVRIEEIDTVNGRHELFIRKN